MMLGSVFGKTLRDNRKGLFWWGLGLVVFGLLNLAFYPDFKDQTEFNKILETSDAIKAFAPNVTSFTSPEGYLNSQLYALMVPILLIIYAVGQGTGAIAGEISRKTLPLLIANPVSRARIISGKFGAIVVSLAVLAAVICATVALAALSFELHVPLENLAAVHVSLFLLATSFGSLGLLLGVITGNRSLAAGTVSALAVASYLAYTLAPLSDSIKPVEQYSPFYYYFQNDPLSNGLDWSHAAVLAVVTAVAFIVSILVFRGRDVRA